jgi:hypothetical protein
MIVEKLPTLLVKWREAIVVRNGIAGIDLV